jgi:hypothetical protein
MNDLGRLVWRGEGCVNDHIDSLKGCRDCRRIAHVSTHVLYIRLARPTRTRLNVEQAYAHTVPAQAVCHMGAEKSCSSSNEKLLSGHVSPWCAKQSRVSRRLTHFPERVAGASPIPDDFTSRPREDKKSE